MNTVGVVVIGRNEGERLVRCLRALAAAGVPLVYVDSGSTDGSLGAARSLGAEIVELDMRLPFSAARARNAGLDRLLSASSLIRHVQFIDGDCEIAGNWLIRAVAELESRDDIAAVCGRLRERHPEASIYNRICDMEWDAMPGVVQSCGGIAMYRLTAFKQVGGFDASVVAGEEPELCMRFRASGWTIVRLQDEMALHDAAMLRFGQWWKRQVRGGYGGSDVARRFDPARQSAFAKQIRSARLWGLAWPAAMCCAGLVGWAGFSARAGLLSALVIGLAGGAQVAKLALRAGRRGAGFQTACAYGFLTLIGKWAHLLGQWRYGRDRRAGRLARLIEYKDTLPVSSAGGVESVGGP